MRPWGSCSRPPASSSSSEPRRGSYGRSTTDLRPIDVAVLVLDRVLLALIVGELLYTLRFVVRTHEIAVEPFLYIGLIAVVRRILIVTAQLERGAPAGRALTNVLLEFGVLGLLVPALASAVFLVRRSRPCRPPDRDIGVLVSFDIRNRMRKYENSLADVRGFI